MHLKGDQKMYMQNAQKKKVNKFESAIRSFERYKTWNEKLLKSGEITEKQFHERLEKRAEMLNL